MASSWIPTHLPLTIQALLFGSLVSFAYFVYVTLTSARPYKQFPLAELSEEGLSPKESWFKRGKDTVIKGLRVYDGPFQIMGGMGPKIIIPNRFAEELKSHPKLGIMSAFAKDFFSSYPGFETFRALELNPKLQPELVRDKINPSLGLIADELVEEAIQAIHDIFGEDEQWQTVSLKSNSSHLIARLSSRVFLGKPLCQDKKWLGIAESFARDVFVAARLLRGVPSLIRPFVHWFLSPCIKLRRHYRDGRSLITPEIEVRKERAHKALQAGQKPPRTADTIGWMYELAEKRQVEFDYVALMLSLVLSSIHTSTESLAQALLDACSHPDILNALREEVIEVIGKEGFSKAALYKLRLMDSFIKESQFWHPTSWVSLNRVVESDIALSDGTVLPAGARIMVANKCLEGPQTSSFDAYRFYRLREESENGDLFQHTSLSAEHMPFGYGQHACPGRFMANTMMKIALCHLLLKYDWALAGDPEASRYEFETNTVVKPDSQIQLCRRQQEIDLSRVAT